MVPTLPSPFRRHRLARSFTVLVSLLTSITACRQPSSTLNAVAAPPIADPRPAVIAASDGKTAAQGRSVPADQWASVRFLLESWEGSSTGHAGTAAVRREYRFVLRDQFIEERNTSTYLPQEKNPKGEVHEHLSYISHDRARRRLVLRQFHGERFVIQYVEEGEASDGKLAFLSEGMENTPRGWRARETYILHGPDEFEEVFELAQAGKPFEVYSRTRLKRSR